MALLLEALDRTVKSSTDVRKQYGLEIFGSLPRFAGSVGTAGHPERQLLNGLPPDNPAAQALSALRSHVVANLVTTVRPVIMVTSCIPGEGKSTVSANLAVSLGQTGGRVLLIGCDLRRPTLGGMFGQNELPGLTELLEHGDQAALRKLSTPPVHLIPGGSIPPYPADLLGSKAMRDFLEYAREKYDYVVIDAPPMLPVTDTQLLAPLCDLRLAVVESCRTKHDMLRQLLESLRSVGQRIDGVVMNDKSGRAARYYETAGAGGIAQPAPVTVEHTPGTRRGVVAPRQWAYRYAGIVVLVTAAIGGYLWLAQPGGESPLASRKLRPAKASPAAADSQSVAASPAETGERPVGKAVPISQNAAVARPAVPVAPTTPVPAAVSPPVTPDAPHVRPVQPVAVDRPVVAGAGSEEPPAAVERVSSAPVPAATGLKSAVRALAESWRKPVPGAPAAGSAGPHGWIAAMGLQATPFGSGLPALLKLGTPLLLEVRTGSGPAWVAIVDRKSYRWQVTPQVDGSGQLTEAELAAAWTGRGYLPWRDPLRLATLNPEDPSPEQVRRLQQLLVGAGALQQFEPGVYDRQTIKAIGQIQATNGQHVNGRLTPETLVLLYQADPAFAVPKFARWP